MNEIKRICKELGLTQKQLAEKIHKRPETVSRWARGKIVPPESIMQLLYYVEKESKS